MKQTEIYLYFLLKKLYKNIYIMNFNFVSKNNIGVVVALLLVILLSQSMFFNFLFDTALGRSVLVLFVLILAYVNKILGVVAVLFIIILFNQSNSGYLEGFTDASGNTSTNKKARTAEKKQIKQNVQANVAAKAEPATTASTKPITPLQPKLTSSLQGGAEGFDVIGTENNIQRGKQSNKIPVSQHMRESMNVSAFDGSYSDYSIF
jgi:hypothetical protein